MGRICINVINLEKISKNKISMYMSIPTQGRNSINKDRQKQSFPSQHCPSVVNNLSYSPHHEFLEGRDYVMCTLSVYLIYTYLVEVNKTTSTVHLVE